MVKQHLAIKTYLENKKALYALEHSVHPISISSTYVLKISDRPPLQHQHSHDSHAPSNNPKHYRRHISSGWVVERDWKEASYLCDSELLSPQTLRCWMGRKDVTQRWGLLLTGQIRLLCWLYTHLWQGKGDLCWHLFSLKDEENKRTQPVLPFQSTFSCWLLKLSWSASWAASWRITCPQCLPSESETCTLCCHSSKQNLLAIEMGYTEDLSKDDATVLGIWSLSPTFLLYLCISLLPCSTDQYLHDLWWKYHLHCNFCSAWRTPLFYSLKIPVWGFNAPKCLLDIKHFQNY